MFNKLKKHPFYNKHRHFIVYVAIGLIGVAIDYGLFLLLYNIFNLNMHLSQIISAHIAFVNNFIFNAFFNFKQSDKLLWRFASYYFTSIVGMLLRDLALFIFVQNLLFNANIVQLFAMASVVVLQFTFNKMITFRASNKKQ
jgi:putative flippase GtrA